MLQAKDFYEVWVKQNPNTKDKDKLWALLENFRNKLIIKNQQKL